MPGRPPTNRSALGGTRAWRLAQGPEWASERSVEQTFVHPWVDAESGATRTCLSGSCPKEAFALCHPPLEGAERCLTFGKAGSRTVQLSAQTFYQLPTLRPRCLPALSPPKARVPPSAKRLAGGRPGIPSFMVSGLSV